MFQISLSSLVGPVQVGERRLYKNVYNLLHPQLLSSVLGRSVWSDGLPGFRVDLLMTAAAETPAQRFEEVLSRGCVFKGASGFTRKQRGKRRSSTQDGRYADAEAGCRSRTGRLHSLSFNQLVDGRRVLFQRSYLIFLRIYMLNK